MNSALAVVPPSTPALFSEERVALIRRTIANGAPEPEFAMFMAVCQRTGLDPISRQIYFIQRGGKWQWQTSIDGYRLIADRTGSYAGSDDAVFAYRPDETDHPDKATVTVWKFVQGQRVPFTASALWAEYSATTGVWPGKPHVMLAKCAEALALRKAFPAELSGLYTREEMEQADAPAPTAPVDFATTTGGRQTLPDPVREDAEYWGKPVTVDADTGEIVVEAEPAEPAMTAWAGPNGFWTWAKSVGIDGKREHVEALIGPIDALTPQQVKDKLVDALAAWKEANKALHAAAKERGLDHAQLKTVWGRMYPEWAADSLKHHPAEDLAAFAEDLSGLSDDQLAALLAPEASVAEAVGM